MVLWIKDYRLTITILSLMISFPCLLSHVVSDDKSDVHFSFEHSVLFSNRFYSFSLLLGKLIMMCLGIIFLMFILVRVCSVF